MSLDDYTALELQRESISCKDLMSHLTEESQLDEIPLNPLTDQGRDLPYFTPEMLTWFRGYIEGPRRSALQEINAAFAAIKSKQRGSGFLLEIELDKIEAREYRDIEHDISEFFKDPNVLHTRKKLEAKTAEYQTMRDEQGGRDATEWKPIQYWFGIIGVVIMEGLINFESFTKIPGITPFFATGMTLLTATFIGYAAHRHGIFVRQFKELMGGHVGRRDKFTTLALDTVGLLLLLVALGIVAWGRYNLLRDIIVLGDVTGEGSLTAWLQLGGAMLGNIGVYLFGVLWSAWRHDRVPDYMELRTEKENIEKQYNKKYSRVVTDRIRQAKKKAEDEKNKKRQADAALQPESDYQQNRAQFERFRKKDSEVLATLGRYRSELVRAIRTNGKTTSFVIRDSFFGVDDLVLGAGVETKRLKPEQYLSSELRLKYTITT